ncbi:MAG TPA: DsbA family protein [Conexibacter sp.]|nr:DsbA family protein [Conexibacter sp.]
MSEPGLSVTHHDGDGPAAHDDAPLDRSQPVFYYDLGSPEAYLAAERVMADLPVVPEWVPIHAAGLPDDGASRASAEERREMVGRRAAAQHVQPLRWPAAWPQEDTRLAMVGATYAKQIGRAVAFALAAFRQAFAGGRVLDEDTVVIAAAACEMHPRAVLQALGRRSVAAALDEATALAAAAGVTQVPAIVFGGRVFEGEDAVEQAAAALAEIASA